MQPAVKKAVATVSQDTVDKVNAARALLGLPKLPAEAIRVVPARFPGAAGTTAEIPETGGFPDPGWRLGPTRASRRRSTLKIRRAAPGRRTALRPGRHRLHTWRAPGESRLSRQQYPRRRRLFSGRGRLAERAPRAIRARHPPRQPGAARPPLAVCFSRISPAPRREQVKTRSLWPMWVA